MCSDFFFLYFWFAIGKNKKFFVWLTMSLRRLTKKKLLQKIKTHNLDVWKHLVQSQALKSTITNTTAALLIQQWWKKHSLGFRFLKVVKNKEDPITYNIPHGKLFYIVESEDIVYRFSAFHLITYYLNGIDHSNPYTRRNLYSPEIRRLCRQSCFRYDYFKIKLRENKWFLCSKDVIDRLIEEYESVFLSPSDPVVNPVLLSRPLVYALRSLSHILTLDLFNFEEDENDEPLNESKAEMS